MKKTTLLLAAVLALSTTAFSQSKKDSYTSIDGGMKYKMIKDVKDGPVAKLGDHIQLHLITKVEDSLIFDTRAAMNGEPAPFQIGNPQSKIDLNHLFTRLSAGDSVIVKIPVDSMIAAGVPQAPWMKANSNQELVYYIQMVSVKSQEQKQKEMAESSAKQKTIDEKLITDYLAAKNIKAQKTESGLYYTIDRLGDGEQPEQGEKVTVNYTGMLLNGEKFDSNVDPAFQHVQPFQFILGQGQVIRGWDEGIAMLKKGTKATLYIPSGLAYGERSPSPKIPANSVLVFDVELLPEEEMQGN